MDEGRPELQKTVTLRQLFTLTVGTILGVAWLIVLGSVIVQAGPIGAVIGFTLGAACMIPIALCYGELASRMPVAGGELVYAHEIFGVRTAYATGMGLVVIYVINCVFFAVSAGWLVADLAPALRGPRLYSMLSSEVHVGDIVAGGVCTALIAWVSGRGARWAALLQDAATYALILAGLVFVGAAILAGRPENLQPLITRSDWAWGWGGVLGVLATTPYFFGGINVAPQAMGELAASEDRRRIGRLLLASIGFSLLFYCAVVMGVALVLPRNELVSAGLPVPAAFAAAFASPLVGKTVLLAALMGLLAVWNALFFAATRALYAMGRGGLLPSHLGRLDPRSRTPNVAIWTVALVTGAGIFLGQGVLLPVVNMTSTLFALMYLVTSVGLLKLRGDRTSRAAAYSAPGGRPMIWLACAVSAYLVILSLGQQSAAAGWGWAPEWTFLLSAIVLAAITYPGLSASRSRLSEAERRAVLNS